MINFIWHYPFPKRQILDSSKLKEFADDNSKFDENGRKLSKQVENTVWKGEIAHYEQFLLFPQCFQKTCSATCKNHGLFGKGLSNVEVCAYLREFFLLSHTNKGWSP